MTEVRVWFARGSLSQSVSQSSEPSLIILLWRLAYIAGENMTTYAPLMLPSNSACVMCAKQQLETAVNAVPTRTRPSITIHLQNIFRRWMLNVNLLAQDALSYSDRNYTLFEPSTIYCITVQLLMALQHDVNM